MRVIEAASIAAFVAAVAFAPRADAQCAGFSDVSPGLSNPFCANVTWMKNRAITLGCTPTLYCAEQGVGRLSMAAFMNRMGDTLTPKVLSAEETGGTLDFSADHIVCQTAVLPAPVGAYPRTFDADASLSFEVSGLQTVYVVPVVSKDGQAWQALGQGSFPVAVAGSRFHATAVTPAFELNDAGPATLQFGLRVSRQNQFTQTITTWTCHLQVAVRNAIFMGQ